jgi:hypothetical protein
VLAVEPLERRIPLLERGAHTPFMPIRAEISPALRRKFQARCGLPV